MNCKSWFYYNNNLATNLFIKILWRERRKCSLTKETIFNSRLSQVFRHERVNTSRSNAWGSSPCGEACRKRSGSSGFPVGLTMRNRHSCTCNFCPATVIQHFLMFQNPMLVIIFRLQNNIAIIKLYKKILRSKT